MQSLSGWQLGTRAVFAAVQKLDAGSVLSLADGSIEIERHGSRESPTELASTWPWIGRPAFLREYLSTYLDEHPAAILQLTRGQDSRILLSAIEPSRRTGLRAVTLSVPESEDVVIAAELAKRCGADHQIVNLEGLADLSPEDAPRAVRSGITPSELHGRPRGDGGPDPRRGDDLPKVHDCQEIAVSTWVLKTAVVRGAVPCRPVPHPRSIRACEPIGSPAPMDTFRHDKRTDDLVSRTGVLPPDSVGTGAS